LIAGAKSPAGAGAGKLKAGDDALSLPPEAPEVMLGDRLFFETRFSQFFFQNCNGDINAPLSRGDPTLAEVPVMEGKGFIGPFRAQGMNCRQCHLGDDFQPGIPYAQRTYCDFTPRSQIPSRDDRLT